jgi:hypothetical protein
MKPFAIISSGGADGTSRRQVAGAAASGRRQEQEAGAYFPFLICHFIYPQITQLHSSASAATKAIRSTKSHEPTRNDTNDKNFVLVGEWFVWFRGSVFWHKSWRFFTQKPKPLEHPEKNSQDSSNA